MEVIFPGYFLLPFFHSTTPARLAPKTFINKKAAESMIRRPK